MSAAPLPCTCQSTPEGRRLTLELGWAQALVGLGADLCGQGMREEVGVGEQEEAAIAVVVLHRQRHPLVPNVEFALWDVRMPDRPQRWPRVPTLRDLQTCMVRSLARTSADRGL